MNYLLNPLSSYGLRPRWGAAGDGSAATTYLCRYSRFRNPLHADVPMLLATLVTANLANIPVLVNSDDNTDYFQLSLKVSSSELLVVKWYFEGTERSPQILARYPRYADDGLNSTTAHGLVDDYCRVLTTHETAPITSCATGSGHEDLTVGFVHVPTRTPIQNQIRLQLGSHDLDDVFATANINDILFCDTKGRSTSVSLHTILNTTSIIWRPAQYENSIDGDFDLSPYEEGLYVSFAWPDAGVVNATLHLDDSIRLDGGVTLTVENNAFAKFVLEGARRVDKISAFVRSHDSESTANIDYERIEGMISESQAALIATISAVDFDQSPTMGLANLIQSQNRVTQALILALLRKSSSRAWFTSLIDKIGDANALLIDDTEIAVIAEKAYRGDAVSNDEIHATPREAYKELFNDRGVNNG